MTVLGVRSRDGVPGRRWWLGWLCLAGVGVMWGAAVHVEAAGVITVKVLVDEEEVTLDSVWQKRLADRVHQASAIIARHAGVQFSVRSFGRWSSENRTQDFSRSLREFEQEVHDDSVKLFIGFSSQYRFSAGRQHLGGTRGPLNSHILIRENSPSTQEPERLEVLVHELGHYLGAAHSASDTSVMRTVVADGRARALSFRIDFDRHNAAILGLVGREVRERRIDNFVRLSPTTLAQLKPHYEALRREFPQDRSAAQYLNVVNALLQQRPPK